MGPPQAIGKRILHHSGLNLSPPLATDGLFPREFACDDGRAARPNRALFNERDSERVEPLLPGDFC